MKSNRRSQTSRRLRLAVTVAVTFFAFYAYMLPLINYSLLSYAKGEAYERFIRPQLSDRQISLSSRLLPRLKDDLWRTDVDANHPVVFLVGNSTQFQMSRELLSASFNCDLGHYYNFAYHSIDPHDSQLMLMKNARDLAPGSTILFAVYPEMFLVAARQGAPSLDHPWTDLETWWLNIEDGNTSIVSLYPILINIEWPLSPSATFPFLRYYSNILELLHDGQRNEYYYRDGSVEFIDIPQQHAERIARGELLDTDNFRVRALATLDDLYHASSFQDFAETVRWLEDRSIRSVAFEAVLNPVYGFARRESPRSMSPYLEFMSSLEASTSLFEYIPIKDTFVDVPDALWYDDAHVSSQGARLVADQLARAIDRSAVCLDSEG